MHRYILVLFLLVNSALAATPQEDAKALLDQLDAAHDANDPDAVGRLLSTDCVVIMTEPSSGAKATRFFTKEAYLNALKRREASASATRGSSTIQAATTSPSGDLFVARDTESRSRVGGNVDWIRSRESLILRPVDGQLKICLVVTEAVFYFPEVPPEPAK